MKPKHESLVGTADKISLQPSSYRQGVRFPAVPLPQDLQIFRRSQARQLRRAPDQSPDAHPRYVQIFALSGSGSIFIKDSAVRLEPGHSILIRPFEPHGYTELSPRGLQWIFVTFVLAQDSALPPPADPVALALSSLDQALLHSLLTEWQQRAPSANARLWAGLLLAPFFQSKGRSTGEPSSVGHEAELIATVNHFVLPRLQEDLSGREIATALHISESHLRSRFRQAAGLPLATHLRNLRVQKACALLRGQSALRISDVADACGFSSLYSFSRTFRAVIGCPPKTFRNASPLPQEK